MRSLLFLLVLLLAHPAAAVPFAWTLQTPRATHHFIGSVHLLPPEAQPLPPAYERALQQAGALVFESDIAGLSGPEGESQILPAARNPKGLQADAGAQRYRRLQQQLKRLSLPPALCDPYRAWFCAMTLEVMAYVQGGYKTELGVDQQLFERARTQGKDIRWLEPLPEHLDLFTGMDRRLSLEFLDSTLDELEEGSSSPEALLALWTRNDLAQLETLLLQMKKQSPRLYQRLLAARNRRWLPRLDALLREEQPVLVVVGAAHYAGPDGLLALLKARGWTLQPVAD